MKTTLIQSALFLLIFTFFSCDDSNDIKEVQLMDNPSVEDGDQSPFSWFHNNGSYNSEWTDEHSYDGLKAIMMTSGIDNGDFGFWGQSIVSDIPYGKKLRLSCQIKLDGISGEGVHIAFRGDGKDVNNKIFFHTTQGTTSISGDKDWQRYSVEMIEPVSEDVTKIWVFLLLGSNTSGTVYFDEVSLQPF